MSKVKRRRHNRHAENAIAKQTGTLVSISQGMAGISRYLECLYELTGHTIDEASAILKAKDDAKRAEIDASTGSDTGGTGDVGGAQESPDPKDPASEPESPTQP